MDTTPATRNVPFDAAFDKAEACFRGSYWLSIVVTVTAVILSIADTVYHLDKGTSAKLGYFNTAMIGLYMFFEYRGSYLFKIAESERKLAFVDNAFDTKFSESSTREYYTNDHIAAGIYKLGVNNMESCFTSNKNLKLMFPRALTKNVIAILLIMFAGIFGEGTYVRLAAESLLAASFALELFKVSVYSSKVSSILNEFYTLFQTLSPERLTNMEIAQIMKLVLEYETTVAWSNTLLDKDNFMKNRLKWDAEWKNIKIRYNIH